MSAGHGYLLVHQTHALRDRHHHRRHDLDEALAAIVAPLLQKVVEDGHEIEHALLAARAPQVHVRRHVLQQEAVAPAAVRLQRDAAEAAVVALDHVHVREEEHDLLVQLRERVSPHPVPQICAGVLPRDLHVGALSE